MKRLILAFAWFILLANCLANNNATVYSEVFSMKPFINNTVTSNTTNRLERPFHNYSANNNDNDLNVRSIKTFYNITDNVDGTDMVFRVIKGTEAKLGDVPYLVGLMKKYSSTGHLYYANCGGTIIGLSTVLTAAHCVPIPDKEHQNWCSKGKIHADDMRDNAVVAGYLKAEGVRRLLEHKDGQWRRVKSGAFNINYDFPTADIAILHMNRPFRFNDHVDSIPWAIDPIDYKGLFCRTAGYGLLANDVESRQLVLADLQVLSKTKCQKLHKRRKMDKFICTSDLISDVHKGDSGGPLVCKGTGDQHEDKKKGVTVGIVCAKIIGRPLSTFFTRVSAYKPFMEENQSSKLVIPNQILASVCLISTLLLF